MSAAHKKKPPQEMKAELIAPCGINCSLCLAYLRDQNRCLGCTVPQAEKSKSRAQCKIKNCEHLAQTSSHFCYDCSIFPCASIKHLDKRYQTKYDTSVIENLNLIKNFGIEFFIDQQKQKHTCANCGGILCVHRENCMFCAQSKKISSTT